MSRRKPRIFRIIGGALILFAAAVNGATSRNQTPLGFPEVLGSLIGALAILALATWLIASGLPKTIGLDEGQRVCAAPKVVSFGGSGIPDLHVVVTCGRNLPVASRRRSYLVALLVCLDLGGLASR